MSGRLESAATEAAAFLEYYEKVRHRTSRVVACIPENHLEWTWREGKFTLGDLVRHIAAIERFMYAENVQGKPSRYPGHGRELADGLPSVRAFFDRTHSESVAIFGALTDVAFGEKSVTPAGAPVTTRKWLRAMVEHEIHHRGQIYLYLSMLDVATPPIYGLTSEEVRARSA
ncbi:MAG: DinB family protein [Acidobacteriota bacterium]